jgi:3-hydroxyacyl-CoA dehydrogenase / enoyl-CoA hydratase / 3-hydroxybutyryl-CoA epimerase
MSNAFTLTINAGIANVVFDLPGEKVNKFSAGVMAELSNLIDDLGKRSDLKVVVFSSGKPSMFIAGADIKELQAISNRTEAQSKALAGQQLFQKVADLRVPTIAVINGPCLGGGMEFALACRYRLVTDEEKTKLGLPEVTLGIIPGWGGTQRLPKLIGLLAAMDMILSGAPINARKAMKLGLADACCSHAFITQELQRFITQVLSPQGEMAIEARRPNSFKRWALERTPVGRMVIFRAAQKALFNKTRGLMQAPLVALEVLRNTCGVSLKRGLEEEAHRFSELAFTAQSKHLIDCFFAGEALRKAGGETSHKITTTAVLGAGVMGGGIAWAFANKNLPVRMKDLSWDAIAKGLQTANEYNRQVIKRKKMTPGDANLLLHRISGTVDFSGFQQADIVVEAVIENLDVKRKVLAEVENHVSDKTILVSNTSSLSIADMAVGLKRPELFAGMHFFNPVNRMPLVEVVAGPATSLDTIAAVAELVRRIGKTAIIVKDCPGFLVNRILLPYLNEAARCLEDGADIEQVDRTIYNFGMPMGPFTLSDEVGLDVGFKVAKILASHYGDRMAVADTLRIAYEDLHLLGTKGGKGFYLHDNKNSKKEQNLPLFTALRERHPATRTVSSEEILNRCLLIMVNEAARCLEENVVDRASSLDLAMVMGTGFPPQKGGLLHYANHLGSRTVADRLQSLSDCCGTRFQPCAMISDLARRNQPFPT